MLLNTNHLNTNYFCTVIGFQIFLSKTNNFQIYIWPVYGSLTGISTQGKSGQII